MDKLRQTLVNAMEIKGIKRSEVAKQVGISSSRVTEFLNDGQEIAFDTVLHIVRILSPEKETELIEQYTYKITTPKNVKFAMEYSSTHRLINCLKYLIEVCNNHKSSSLKKWSQTYGLIYEWQTLSYSDEQSLYKRIRLHDTTVTELKVLSYILECHLLRKLDQNELIKPVYEIAQEELENIKDGFIKKSLICRLNEMLGIIELKVNCNFQAAQSHAKSILESNNGSSYNGYAYYILGMSCLTEDFGKSLYYLEESIKEYKKSNSFKNIKAINGNISLLHFYWGKSNKNNDSDDLYNLSVKKNKNIKELVSDKQKHILTTYLGECLEGYATDNSDLILKALVKSANSKDNFMVRVIKQKFKSAFPSNEMPDYMESIVNIA